MKLLIDQLKENNAQKYRKHKEENKKQKGYTGKMKAGRLRQKSC